MLEWLGLLLGLVVLPALVAWRVCTHGFVPGGTAVGTVVEIQTQREDVIGRRRDGRARNRTVLRYVPVVEYRLGGRTFVATSVMPDFTERLVPGDRVRVVVDRMDRTRVLLAYWNPRP